MPHAHSRAPVLVQNAARGALDVSPEVRGRRKVEVDAETVLDPRHDPIDGKGTPEAYRSRGSAFIRAILQNTKVNPDWTKDGVAKVVSTPRFHMQKRAVEPR